MKFPITICAAIAASLTFAVPAVAQTATRTGDGSSNQAQPAEEEGSEIMVLGRKARQQAIVEYVGALTEIDAGSPLARFLDNTFCPGVVGLSADRNAFIAARMRQVADAAGIEPAKAGCPANALVIFASDKEELIAALRGKHPIFFRDLDGSTSKTPKQPGPATAWQINARVDRNGDPVPVSEEGGFSVVESPITASRLRSVMRPVFAGSVVVIQLDGLIGLTPTQIADYAVVRSLTETDPDVIAQMQAPTILKVLDAPIGSSVPETLTEWDLSYLQARYATDEFLKGQSQRSQIRNRIAKDLDATAAAAADPQD